MPAATRPSPSRAADRRPPAHGLAAAALLALWATLAPAQSAPPVPAPAAAPAASAAPSPAPTAPATVPAPGAAAGLDARIEALKAQVVQLNRDLLVLEEELLFPAGTQLAVFVSMDVGLLFALESVQLKVADQVVAQHLYTPLEVAALQRGGVQRLYLGNLKTGTHELTAFFTGRGPHERDYRRAATVKVEKAAGPRYVELRIVDRTGKLQPEFATKVWE